MTPRRLGAVLILLGLACGGCGDESRSASLATGPTPESRPTTDEPAPAEVPPAEVPPAEVPPAEVPPAEVPGHPWDLLGCPQARAGLWMTDAGEPPPGVTVADIVARESDPAAGVEAVELDRQGGRVWVGLQRDGSTTAVIALERWPTNGSWYVGSGAYCPGSGRWP